MSKFDKINELFDIRSLLQTRNPIKAHLGITKVELDRTTNSKGSKAVQIYLTDSHGRQRILLYDRDKESGEKLAYFRYANMEHRADRGDILQFISNRLPEGTVRKAEELLHRLDYRRNAARWKENEEFEIKRPGAGRSALPFDVDDFENLRPITELIELEQPHYLEKRYISNDVLEDPLFTGKVYVYEYLDKFKNVHDNIFFPKTRFGSERFEGAEVKTPYRKDYAFGDDRLLWCSNPPDEINKIVVTESAVDAISHYQLGRKDNAKTWYFSTGGNFYPEKQRHFFSILEEAGIDRKYTHLISAMDNDIEGMGYDLALLNHTLSLKLGRKEATGNEYYSLSNEGGRPSLRLTTDDSTLMKEANSHFLEIADHLNRTYLRNRENHFCEVHGSKDHVSLVFPSKKKLERVAKSLPLSILKNIKALSFENTFVQKPEFGSDWNDSLAHHMKLQFAQASKPSIKRKF